MSRNWVVNASPLILLAKIGRLDLLPKLTQRLVVPASVLAEIQAGAAADPARDWLHTHSVSAIVPDPTIEPDIAAWNLGAGETAVLSWAYQHHDFEAILDDRAARKCARIHNLPVRGTLGVILAAKAGQAIPAARPLCEALVQAGLHIEPALVRDALQLVGE